VTLTTADVSLPELDVVIPVAPKDAPGVRFCLDSVLRHCRNPIRAVHVVSRFPVTAPDQRVRWLDESLVVPGIGDIDAALREAGSPHPNASWYFQQLLKLRNAWSIRVIAVNKPGYYDAIEHARNETSETISIQETIAQIKGIPLEDAEAQWDEQVEAARHRRQAG
jgi:hypothetical protein